MARLLDLPAEVIFMIMQYLRGEMDATVVPEGLNNLALVCRALSGFRIYEPKYVLQNDSVRMHLSFLASHQHVLEYIEKVTLVVPRCMKPGWCSKHRVGCDNAESQEYLAVLDDRFKLVLERLDLWHSMKDHNQWMESILKKCPDLDYRTEATLLFLAPRRLKELCLSAVGSEDSTHPDYGQLDNCVDLYRISEFLPNSLWHSSHLRHLQSLELDSFEVLQESDTIAFQGMNIKRLVLTRCYVESHCWETLLARFPKLHSHVQNAPVTLEPDSYYYSGSDSYYNSDYDSDYDTVFDTDEDTDEEQDEWQDRVEPDEWQDRVELDERQDRVEPDERQDRVEPDERQDRVEPDERQERVKSDERQESVVVPMLTQDCSAI